MSNPHEGHRARTRKEFLEKGLAHMPDHEKLELLLYYSIPRGDTNLIGHALMNRFGSFAGVFDAPFELLREVEGVGDASATQIKVIAALIRAYMDDYSNAHNTIRSAADAREFMCYKFLCESAERVLMACVGGNGKVVYCDVVAEGSPESVQLRPSVLIRTALLANAVRVVLAHNHPNGICNPSQNDLHATRVLQAEFSRLNIELYDHVIIAPGGSFSMRESGMLT